MAKLTGSPLFLTLALSLAMSTLSGAKDIRITFPKKSKPTPVQAYNHDGVKALEKHEYTKAKRLFYKAYLLDPNDPFTLNNLGYIAELEGDVDRAQRFYELSTKENSEATVDSASLESAKGKTVAAVAGHAETGGIQVNTLNVQALSLLNKDRPSEADLVLQKALKLDPRNPFTLNNLGYARETQGELESAVSFYTAAANTHSTEPIIVSPKSGWRGKKISEIAADNAKKVRKALRESEDLQVQAARLNLRGVSALNRNDRRSARKYFEQAYKVAPNDAFTLNNMGYVAEMDGDRETAETFYAKAREAERSGSRVTLASRKEAEGKRLNEVADQSDNQVYSAMEAAAEARRRRGGPVVLKKRDNSVVTPLQQPQEENQLPQMDQPPTDLQQPLADDSPDPIAKPKENQKPASKPK